MANPNRNWGKEIKDVGLLIIIVGVVMLALVLYLFIADSDSALAYLVDKHFFFLVIGGLIALLSGIIVRSIGKSKETKSEKKD